MHDIDLALEILLDGVHPTLWESRCMRETMRFLRKRGKDIPRSSYSRLIKAILAGPSREQYRGDLTDEEWGKLRDHKIRLHLYKIRESGAMLPKAAMRAFDRIQRDLPWQPRGDMSEEFPFFTSTGWGRGDEPVSMENFSGMSVEDFIHWAEKQTGRPWECGGGWHVFAANNSKTALKLLRSASECEVWPVLPWYTLLSQFETSKNLKREIAKTVANMPLDVLAKLDLQSARWLESVRKCLTKGSRQNLWRRIWDASLMGDAPEGDLNFDKALNHAGGVLGSILYREMAEYIPEVAAGEYPGFPIRLYPDFEKFSGDDSPSAKLARVQIVPMLFILYRIDSEWTSRSLLSRMDLDESETYDPHLWEGFLWNARCSDDLLVVIKEMFFKVLHNLDRIPERIRSHGPQLFIYMAIPPDRGIDSDEARGVLYNFEPEYLADAAWAIKDLLEAAGNKSPVLWRETIGPWFEKAWPKHPQARSPELSEKLAWMAIDAGPAFPDVVHAIKDIMTQEKHQGALFHLKMNEEENGLVSRFPDAALTLVDKLVGENSGTLGDTLSVVLDAISSADPDLQTTSTFERLTLMAQ